MPARAHFILYVRDQAVSAAFYAQALAQAATLDVPGMTEFTLREGCVLGLMPEAGIRILLGEKLPDPARAAGIDNIFSLPGGLAEGAPRDSAFPRAELYLIVEDPGACHRRALAAGARELSALMPRDWGHRAAYSLDPDGHVLAFAEVIKPPC